MTGTTATSPPQAEPSGVPPAQFEGRLLGPRPAAYLSIILPVVFGVCIYTLRHDGIFACQASGYGSDRYLAYCQATRYADYDHGAFWFRLEPAASDAAANAEVLFLGNSRTQVGFSSAATADWFSVNRARYYLLGFSYNGNYRFEAPLLQKLTPRARVYVINLDLFFEPSESPPAQAVMRDPSARGRDEQKRLWQRVHRPFCSWLPGLCGDARVIYRSRATGTWLVTGGTLKRTPISYDDSVDQNEVAAYTAAGKEFLARLPVDRACVLLTFVPKPGTSSGTARGIAASLGLDLIAPELAGLSTFDGSHLDQESAERWSSAFLDSAGPRIRKCLGEPGR